MNNYNYNGYKVDLETPEERYLKRQRLTKLFSRVFLALFIYTLLSEFLASAIYFTAAAFMPEEQYLAFSKNNVIAILISAVVQYLVAFPVFLLIVAGTDKAKERKKSPLAFKDIALAICIGQAMMLLGSMVSSFISTRIQMITGAQPENRVDTLVNEVPTYLIFIVVVILAPIFEELIFRKLMIDRLSIYGDKMAIIFTAVAFGLIHANFYQLFYATLLGFVLGYVYTKTGQVKYTIIIHSAINFLGSIVSIFVEKSYDTFLPTFEKLMDGSLGLESINMSEFLFNGTVVFSFTNMQYGILIGGIIAIFYYFKNKKISISTEKEIYIPDREIARCGVENVGAILFIALSVLLTFISTII